MRKGLVDWLKSESPDVICIQETKANKDQVEKMAMQACQRKRFLASTATQQLTHMYAYIQIHCAGSGSCNWDHGPV